MTEYTVSKFLKTSEIYLRMTEKNIVNKTIKHEFYKNLPKNISVYHPEHLMKMASNDL